MIGIFASRNSSKTFSSRAFQTPASTTSIATSTWLIASLALALSNRESTRTRPEWMPGVSTNTN